MLRNFESRAFWFQTHWISVINNAWNRSINRNHSSILFRSNFCARCSKIFWSIKCSINQFESFINHEFRSFLTKLWSKSSRLESFRKFNQKIKKKSSFLQCMTTFNATTILFRKTRIIFRNWFISNSMCLYRICFFIQFTLSNDVMS